MVLVLSVWLKLVVVSMPLQNAENWCELDQLGIEKVETPPEKAKLWTRVFDFGPGKAKIQTRKSENLALKKSQNFGQTFGGASRGLCFLC